MSLMGGIYVGTSGLQTSSNALNTSAHNLANVQTAGYTRQQILQGNRVYNTVGQAGIADMQVGLGVDYTKCRQVRDVFLDASYRKESGRAAFYEICTESTDEIETLLGELEGASFKESLNNLWTSVQELQKDPSSAVTEGLFVSSCAQFLERATAVSQGLYNYQDNLNERVYGMVDEINEIVDDIYDLTHKINYYEIGSEEANDLRDERNTLIDKLSTYVNTRVVNNADGGLEIYVEGNPIILGEQVNHLSTTKNEAGFYNVTWGNLYNNMDVFDFKQEVSSVTGTDVGKLRAILLARGDRRANYSDIDDNKVDEYNKGSADPLSNDIPIASSIVMNVQAEFDRLIHNITTALNNVMCDYAQNSSETNSIEIFQRLGSDRYDSDGNYIKEETDSHADISTMYTVMNLKINPDLIKQPTLNGFMNADKTVDYDKAAKIAEVFSGMGQVEDLNNPGTMIDAAAAINPNANSKLGYMTYYDSMVGAIANTGYVYSSITNSQTATADSLVEARNQVLGVSSEEELQNIIKFQNAYNASSRYINVVSEMLEQIIEKL